jgi:hypothetical protein
VEEARLRREARWKLLFSLAWDGKGIVLDATQIPDDLMDQLVEWRNECVERENAAMKGGTA